MQRIFWFPLLLSFSPKPLTHLSNLKAKTSGVLGAGPSRIPPTPGSDLPTQNNVDLALGYFNTFCAAFTFPPAVCYHGSPPTLHHSQHHTELPRVCPLTTCRSFNQQKLPLSPKTARRKIGKTGRGAGELLKEPVLPIQKQGVLLHGPPDSRDQKLDK